MKSFGLTRRSLIGSSIAGGACFFAGTGRSSASTLTDAIGSRGSGVRLVQLSNGHKVWTQRLGRGPKKVLILHGGPGFSHDYLQCFAKFLPAAGYEMYFYDQLGCGRSDHPSDPSLWRVERYREEVEEVRRALGLDHFILYGHSWGGILAIEYALKYQRNLEALVLSNMTASFADYGRYTAKLRAGLPAPVRARLDMLEASGKVTSPAFDDLLQKELYTRYVCRLRHWPSPVLETLKTLNPVIYNQMQGANEFAITGNLKPWNRWADLPQIQVPTLVMGARYDEMDPISIRREAALIPNAKLFISNTGSHLSMWDDQINYFNSLINFLRNI